MVVQTAVTDPTVAVSSDIYYDEEALENSLGALYEASAMQPMSPQPVTPMPIEEGQVVHGNVEYDPETLENSLKLYMEQIYALFSVTDPSMEVNSNVFFD